MYSKHFDSKEFLLQIMNSFEAEAEQLLKIYINKHKSETSCPYYNVKLS